MVKRQIIEQVQQKTGAELLNIKRVGGGSINRAYCLETENGNYFIKINSSSKFPGMFEVEAAGLQLLSQSRSVNVPEVILCSDADDESFLLMEWVDARKPTAKASEDLGRSLAQMHKNVAACFGLDHDNYMGSLPQSNRQHDTWSAFFIEERLQPMVAMALDKRLLKHNDAAVFEQLYKNLPDLFEDEAPSLIHGDLWGGNYLVDQDDRPYLIDPAVSYGHREFDLAMTTLFGGFADEFYKAYHESFPLEEGWERRVDLWNLYPLLVHLNLFGIGYLGQVRDCLRGYV